MKEIVLKHFLKTRFENRDSYSVYLGNGTINRFSNLKDAKRFLANTNEFLTDEFHALHSIYVAVLNEYHLNYFCFDPANSRANLLLKEKEIILHLGNTQNSLQIALNRCAHTNGNHFTFKHFFNAIESLEKAIYLLGDLAFVLQLHSTKHRLNKCLRELLQSKNLLQDYGRKSSTLSYSVPNHLADDEQEFIPEMLNLKRA